MWRQPFKSADNNLDSPFATLSQKPKLIVKQGMATSRTATY